MLNKSILIGRWTKDIELSYAKSGTPISKATLAVDGYKKDDTNFIRITMFGKVAENVSQYSGKGRLVAVEGHIQTGSYDNKEGKKVFTFDVIASNVKFLDKSKKNDMAVNTQEPYLDDLYPVEGDEEELPF